MDEIKTYWKIVVMVCVWMVLVACTDAIEVIDDDMMTINKAELSEETTEILEMLGHAVYFFDYKVDDTIVNVSLNVWVYDEQEQWSKAISITDSIQSNDNRIIFQIAEDSYDLIHVSGNGYGKSNSEKGSDYSKSSMIAESPLANPTTIKPGEEITLWVKLGTNKDTLSTGGDFRDKDINAGMALTVTFHDEDCFMNSS